MWKCLRRWWMHERRLLGRKRLWRRLRKLLRRMRRRWLHKQLRWLQRRLCQQLLG